jgi:NTE family protein
MHWQSLQHFQVGSAPLRIDASQYVWRRRPWNAPIGSEVPVNIGYNTLHLNDGGVYDNLGLEPFFDCGKQQVKLPEHRIIVSDAGAPLPTVFLLRSYDPRRLKRIADIMSDQSHALRVRCFANYLLQNPKQGRSDLY